MSLPHNDDRFTAADLDNLVDEFNPNKASGIDTFEVNPQNTDKKLTHRYALSTEGPYCRF